MMRDMMENARLGRLLHVCGRQTATARRLHREKRRMAATASSRPTAHEDTTEGP